MPKVDKNKLGTKRDVFEIVGDAAETILEGMDQMFREQDKKNEEKFTTKEDLKNLATKEDLKRETGFLRDDIKGLKADLSTTVSMGEFEKLESRVIRLESRPN